jgi:hypothetical protein
LKKIRLLSACLLALACLAGCNPLQLTDTSDPTGTPTPTLSSGTLSIQNATICKFSVSLDGGAYYAVGAYSNGSYQNVSGGNHSVSLSAISPCTGGGTSSFFINGNTKTLAITATPTGWKTQIY